MSEYSQGRERILARMGLPFCLGETRIEEPEDFVGRACGIGWTTLGAVVVEEVEACCGGGWVTFWGTGCWTLWGVGCVGLDFDASDAARAARKSASPKSSSSSMVIVVVVDIRKELGRDVDVMS